MVALHVECPVEPIHIVPLEGQCLADPQTKDAREQFLQAAVAQNIKRLVRFLTSRQYLVWKLPRN
jgi:hypothetical protein